MTSFEWMIVIGYIAFMAAVRWIWMIQAKRRYGIRRYTERYTTRYLEDGSIETEYTIVEAK